MTKYRWIGFPLAKLVWILGWNPLSSSKMKLEVIFVVVVVIVFIVVSGLTQHSQDP